MEQDGHCPHADRHTTDEERVGNSTSSWPPFALMGFCVAFFYFLPTRILYDAPQGFIPIRRIFRVLDAEIITSCGGLYSDAVWHHIGIRVSPLDVNVVCAPEVKPRDGSRCKATAVETCLVVLPSRCECR